jgi:hypothetical protein
VVAESSKSRRLTVVFVVVVAAAVLARRWRRRLDRRRMVDRPPGLHATAWRRCHLASVNSAAAAVSPVPTVVYFLSADRAVEVTRQGRSSPRTLLR